MIEFEFIYVYHPCKSKIKLLIYKDDYFTSIHFFSPPFYNSRKQAVFISKKCISTKKTTNQFGYERTNHAHPIDYRCIQI